MAIITILLLACAPKTSVLQTANVADGSNESVVENTLPLVVEEPVPEPEPEPELINADFDIVTTTANGTTFAGHVKRIERSSDWYGEADWLSAPAKLTISGEQTSAEKEITWPEVAKISISLGNIGNDVDCYYDSAWSPWMYDCTLKTTGTVTLKDGSKWSISNRHKWKLTFTDDTTVEFWLKKHSARAQDSEVVTMSSGTTENYGLYTSLQQRLREEAKTTIITSILVQ